MTKEIVNDELTTQAGKLKHLIPAAKDTETGDDTVNENEKAIMAGELVGAFKGLELSKALQLAAQAELLEKIHREKLYREYGINSFREFVKTKLGVSGSLVYEILQQRERLGAAVYEALLACKLDYKVIKALASPEVNATPTEDKTPVLKIKDEVIEITPENRGVIQALVKDVMAELKNAEKDTKEEMKRRFELEKKVKELEQPKTVTIPNKEQYQRDGDALVLKFEALLNELDAHGKTSLIDNRKYAIFMSTVHAFNFRWGDRIEAYETRTFINEE